MEVNQAPFHWTIGSSSKSSKIVAQYIQYLISYSFPTRRNIYPFPASFTLFVHLPRSIPVFGLFSCHVPIRVPHVPIFNHGYTTNIMSAKLDAPSGIGVEYGKTYSSRPNVTPVHRPVNFQSRPKPSPKDMGSATT